MNLKEIQQLVKLIASSNVDVLEIEEGDFHLKIKKNEGKQAKIAMAPIMSAPTIESPNPVSSSPQTLEPKAVDAPRANSEQASGIEIKSPMIGTFYRSSSPDKPSFVNVGDEIKVGQTICIVEAMKLFNEIESEVDGRIIKVLVDDASPVEYDQPLFLVESI